MGDGRTDELGIYSWYAIFPISGGSTKVLGGGLTLLALRTVCCVAGGTGVCISYVFGLLSSIFTALRVLSFGVDELMYYCRIMYLLYSQGG